MKRMLLIAMAIAVLLLLPAGLALAEGHGGGRGGVARISGGQGGGMRGGESHMTIGARSISRGGEMGFRGGVAEPRFLNVGPRTRTEFMRPAGEQIGRFERFDNDRGFAVRGGERFEGFRRVSPFMIRDHDGDWDDAWGGGVWDGDDVGFFDEHRFDGGRSAVIGHPFFGSQGISETRESLREGINSQIREMNAARPTFER